MAGARLDISNANSFMYNDRPEHNFYYKDVIKSFDSSFSDEHLFSEICSLVVDKELSSKFVLVRLVNSLIEFSKEQGCTYSVGVAYQELCNLYQEMFKKYGSNFKIFYDILYPLSGQYKNGKKPLEVFPMILKFNARH